MPSYTPTPITPGATSDANADVNNELTAIANILNGAIDSGNLAADAVGNSELAPNAVTDTEVAAAADIAVSKLEAGTVGSVLRTAAGPTPTWLTLGSEGALLYAGAADVAYTAAPTDGQVLRSVGTTPTWQDPEIAYQEFTAVTVTGTSEGAATAVVSAGAIVFEAVPHLIEFFSPRIQAPTSVGLFVVLYDGTTALGELTVLDSSNPRTTRGGVFPVRLTPTAASHTYNVKSYVGSGSGLVDGGVGGTGARVPGYIRITRI